MAFSSSSLLLLLRSNSTTSIYITEPLLKTLFGLGEPRYTFSLNIDEFRLILGLSLGLLIMQVDPGNCCLNLGSQAQSSMFYITKGRQSYRKHSTDKYSSEDSFSTFLMKTFQSRTSFFYTTRPLRSLSISFKECI